MSVVEEEEQEDVLEEEDGLKEEELAAVILVQKRRPPSTTNQRRTSQTRHSTMTRIGEEDLVLLLVEAVLVPRAGVPAPNRNQMVNAATTSPENTPLLVLKTLCSTNTIRTRTRTTKVTERNKSKRTPPNSPNYHWNKINITRHFQPSTPNHHHHRLLLPYRCRHHLRPDPLVLMRGRAHMESP